MPRPMTADPLAWGEYNAKLAAMTREEFEAEQASVRAQCAQESVLDCTVAVLTPSGELLSYVNRLLSVLNDDSKSLAYRVGYAQTWATMLVDDYGAAE